LSRDSAVHHRGDGPAELWPSLGVDTPGTTKQTVGVEELEIVEIGHRPGAHTLGGSERNLGGNVANRRGDRGHDDASQSRHDASPGEHDDRTNLLIGDIGPPDVPSPILRSSGFTC